MKKKKLSVQHLKVTSFTTTTKAEDQLKGGFASPSFTVPVEECNCWPDEPTGLGPSCEYTHCAGSDCDGTAPIG